ncbi:MAG: glycosyltransferase family 39 protein [Anaerolineales bacterium]
MKSPFAAVGLWILALAMVGLLAERTGWSPRLPPKEAAAAAAIVLLGLGLRVWDLQGTPLVISGNEASVGLEALDIAEGRHNNLFDTGWFSFPSLYFAIQSLPLRWLGISIGAVRITSAFAGALTIAATYLYARVAWGKRIALVSAAFVCAFAFHIHFSRLGLNNIWDGLFAALVAAGLTYGVKSGRRSGYLLAGAALGLGQFFYVSTRVFLILIPVWGLATLSRDRGLARRRLEGLGLLGWAAVVVTLPLILFYARHPQEFLAPISRVNLFGWWWQVQTVNFGDPAWWVLGEQALNAIGGFGLVPLREFYAGQPLLTGLGFALLVVGVAVLMRRWKEARNLLLLLWIASAIAVVALSANAPAAQRYVFVAPAVSTIVAVGLSRLAERAAALGPRPGLRAPTWAAILLCVAMISEAGYYFAKYSAEQRFGDYNEERVTQAVYYLRDLEPRSEVVFLSSPRLILSSHDTLLFLLPGLMAQDLLPGKPLSETRLQSARPLFVVLLEREADLAEIMRCFPGGPPVRIEGRRGRLLFIAYQAREAMMEECQAPKGKPMAGRIPLPVDGRRTP